MARCGVASRRACEAVIAAGRVRVNGVVVTTLGTKVDPEVDVVEVDGRIIRPTPRRRYIMLHKPKGHVTTVRDPQGRPTVVDLLAGVAERVFPVGRLDVDTEGLLLLTDDGELAHRVMHPRYEVKKRYRATVIGAIDDAALRLLERGVPLEDGVTAPARARLLKRFGDRSVVELTIVEGRNRQVRRMFQFVGHPVVRLVRLAVGPVRLAGLPRGAWRDLTEAELAALRRAVGLGEK